MLREVRRFSLCLILILSVPTIAWSQSVKPVEIVIGKGPRQPHVTIGRDRTIHVVYGRGDAVHYAASFDGGKSCEPPLQAFECRNMSLGMHRGPRIAVSRKTIIVTAIGGAKGRGQDGDLQAWHRQEDGTWVGPVRINDVISSAREGLHGMASGPDGTVWCAWLDLRNKRTEVYGAKSVDGGKTWARNTLVYRSPEKSVCECCHPSVAVAAGNRVSVMFRNSLGGNRDIFVATSTDGETFGEARPLSKEKWKLRACPMDGGMFAIDPSGDQGWSVYRRDKQVFLADLAGTETLLGAGQDPVVAWTKAGPLSVWSSQEGLMVKTPSSPNEVSLGAGGSYPAVASDLSGELVVAVWEKFQDEHVNSIRMISFPTTREP